MRDLRETWNSLGDRASQGQLEDELSVMCLNFGTEMHFI
jgi:hypothetical protein